MAYEVPAAAAAVRVPVDPLEPVVPPVGEVSVLALVDGLWPRDPVDALLAWEDVEERVSAIGEAVGPGTELDDLDAIQRYTVGMLFAARWTLNLRPHAPLTGAVGPLTVRGVDREIAVAEHFLIAHDPLWDIAGGVRAWLCWITAQVDHLVYLRR